MTAPHASTDDLLRASVRADGRVTLDPRFAGLPETAHGGTVLALFDAVASRGGASRAGARVVAGTYRRRVPLGSPLTLAVERSDPVTRVRLLDGATLLVDGTVEDGIGPESPGAPPSARSPESVLPLSKTCFACGTENALGLRVQLAIDDDRVHSVWTPRDELRITGQDRLAPVALTALLDEAAFWLGAAASGESGMTTELRVRLHAPVAFGKPIVVAGSRAAVHARAEDPRYWETSVAAWDGAGTLVASAAITFVAVRGAARKLVTGLLAVNPADVLRRVFPAYVP